MAEVHILAGVPYDYDGGEYTVTLNGKTYTFGINEQRYDEVHYLSDFVSKRLNDEFLYFIAEVESSDFHESSQIEIAFFKVRK